jgi:hypothetical protein
VWASRAKEENRISSDFDAVCFKMKICAYLDSVPKRDNKKYQLRTNGARQFRPFSYNTDKRAVGDANRAMVSARIVSDFDPMCFKMKICT